MPKCGCSGSTCNCLIVDGSTTTVSGAGTVADPYVIEVSASPVSITAGAGVYLTGAGTIDSPYQINVYEATATQLGGIMLTADLGGTASAPKVAKIAGATISANPGIPDNTVFLAGDGTWKAASQGGINVPARLNGAETSDWNAVIYPGWWWGNNAAHQPVTDAAIPVKLWAGQVTALASGTTLQQRLVAAAGTAGREYVRISTNGGATWTDWREAIGAHVGTAPGTGRAYFSTDDFWDDGSQTNANSTYIGLSPADEPSNTNALWVTVGGRTILNLQKNPVIPIALSDTGWVTTGLAFAMASGWSMNSYRVRKQNNRVIGYIKVNRTGGTITTSNTSGDISPDLPILTMPSGWRVSTGSVWLTGGQVWIGNWVMVLIDTTNQIILGGGYPGASLGTGAVMYIQLDFVTD